ncbi:MAG: hypothetical protein ACT4O0_18125 [Pseudonocardia sp.]
MSEFRSWATDWLNSLVHLGNPQGPHAPRNLLLHDDVWSALASDQVRRQLTELRESTATEPRHGKCAVAYESPWRGQQAVWIEAIDYWNGVPRDRLDLVQALDAKTPAATPSATETPAVAARLTERPPSSTPRVVPAPIAGPRNQPPLPTVAQDQRPALPDLPSTRATFWWTFLLAVLLLPLALVWLFPANQARRTADAQGEDGSRYITAWIKGCAAGAAAATLAWFALLALIFGFLAAEYNSSTRGAPAEGGFSVNVAAISGTATDGIVRPIRTREPLQVISGRDDA